MSNPVSLHIEEQDDCIAELSDPDVINCERDPNLKDYLADANSDMYTFELSELYRANGSALKYQPPDRLINIILWSWIDKNHMICDVAKDVAEELGLDLAIGPKSIQELAPVIRGFNSVSVSRAIFGENEIWQTADELAEYLQLWSQAFTDALNQGKGLYYKIWV